MAKVSLDHLRKWDEQLKGGFHLDVTHFFTWKEKQAVKRIPLEDGRMIEASLEYHERHEGDKPLGNVVGQQPVVRLSIWRETDSGLWASSGMGYCLDVGTLQNKKNFKELCRLSAEISDEWVLEQAMKHLATLSNAVII